jgi:hypothetical protein
VVEARVEAWRVHDTGLVAVPSPFRRLGGLVRHLQGQGERWPDRVLLELTDEELRVTGADGPVGGWSRGAVRVRVVSEGPPLTFVLDVPGSSQLLAAAATPNARAVLAALGREPAS